MLTLCLWASVARDAYAQPASVSTLPPVRFAPQGGLIQPGTPGFVQPGVAPTFSQPGTAPLSMPSHVPLGINQAAIPTQLPSGFGQAVVPPPVASPLPTFQPSPSDQVLAPTATQPGLQPGGNGFNPVLPPNLNGGAPLGGIPPVTERTAPIDVYVQEARTQRLIIGGTVNSDLGVAGKLIFEERNFNFSRFTRGSRFLRGGNQHLRLEAMPGNEVQRYAASWSQPNLFGYLPYSLSLGGYYYTRELRDWHEQRGGGRVALGFDDNRGFSISSELRMEDVKLFRPRVAGVQELDAALGSNDVYRVRFRAARDTRDSPFLTTDGGMLELMFDQVFGEYDYPRGQITWLRYFTLGSTLDPTLGTQTLTHSWKIGLSGAQTPIFENFFAGGYSTLRGFDFRGASPKVSDVQIGGQLSFLGSLEYSLPITADDMLRGVAFVDYGTVEQDIEVSSENIRVSLGLGLRVFVPAISPAPFAFDFAYPVAMADTDERRIFNFFVGATR